MKPTSFSIRIPEPCHEDWNNMQPDDKGKFCKACCKSVYNFSEKTPNEIRDVLLQHAPGKVCGYFKETQLDRPLTVLPDRRLMSVNRRFVLAVYLVFGSLLFSCKTIPELEKKPHIEWKEGPVFHRDYTEIKYGPADYIYYLEGSTDTIMLDRSPNGLYISEQDTNSNR